MPIHGFDPVALAKHQLARDRQRTLRFPDLFVRKLRRMKASPLAFLRGAAPLFYDMLSARPALGRGPTGEGWLVGDLHLENFGAFKTTSLVAPAAKKSGEKRPRPDEETRGPSVAFDLNDFDDAFVGPWRIDVLRLVTSLILGGRELGADGTRSLALCDGLLDAYVAAAFYGAPPPAPPRPVRRLIEQLASRSRRQLLGDRTEVRKGRRRFVRGERYRELPRAVAAEVPAAFARFVASLPAHERPDAAQAEVVDCALRVAGTGSLGGLRVAVLTAGKGGTDGGWVFDLKEQGTPSGGVLFTPPTKLGHAQRVVTALRSCVTRPPRMLGTTRLGRLDMFCRRLAPQEDKLDLRSLEDADLDPLASYLGALLGAAHARGATRRPTRAWSRSDRDQLLDRAIAIAGVHEAVYLALCRLMREV